MDTELVSVHTPDHAALDARDAPTSASVNLNSVCQNNKRLVETLSKRRCIQIACGPNHTCAITDNGALWTWGDNRYGQLGHGNTRDCGTPCRVRSLEALDTCVQTSCGHDFTAAVNRHT